MIINENEILEDSEYPNEELALACLLASGHLFLNNTKFGKENTTCVFVIANDVFAWACADAEPITNNDHENPSEIIELYKLWKENEIYGPIKWLCIKRNEQPQDPIKENMKKANYWDDTLEKLPPNYYWSKIKEKKINKL